MHWLRAYSKSLLLSALVLAIYRGVASEELQDRTDDFDLKLSLYHPSDGPERAIEGLQLQFPTTTIGRDTPSVKQLLQQSHIWPNADAFGLVYALNPDMKSAGPLRPGDQVRIPELVLTPEVARAVSVGFWVKIRYNGRMIGEVEAAREQIVALGARVQALSDDRFTNADATRRCLSDGSEDLVAIADALQRMDRPIDQEMLFQVRGDVNVLSDVLQLTLAKSRQKLLPADTETICRVAKDLRIKQETFGSVRGPADPSEKWPKVLVIVHTMNSATLTEVRGLTVHYVPEALQDRPSWEKPMGGLSSPVSAQMPEADYVFWATRGPAVVSEYKKCPVREEKDKPFVCDLSVKP